MKADRVEVIGEGSSTRIYYGSYYCQTDPKTGERIFPPQLRHDRLAIMDFGDQQGNRYFPMAQMVPAPAQDPGQPQWDLRRARGVYTLQVAVYYASGQIPDPKKAALDLVRHLRHEGLEAYYFHDETMSIVTVGAFGEDAIRQTYPSKQYVKTPDGGVATVRATPLVEYSAKVKQLQQHPLCQYNLTNNSIIYAQASKGQKQPVRSTLVKIPSEFDK